jgi:hypothetical protein
MIHYHENTFFNFPFRKYTLINGLMICIRLRCRFKTQRQEIIASNVGSENLNKSNHTSNLGLTGRINLKLILKKENWKNPID